MACPRSHLHVECARILLASRVLGGSNCRNQAVPCLRRQIFDQYKSWWELEKRKREKGRKKRKGGEKEKGEGKREKMQGQPAEPIKELHF